MPRCMRYYPQFPDKIYSSDFLCLQVDTHAYGQKAPGASAEAGDIEMSLSTVVRAPQPAVASLYCDI
eukprot:2079942-Rhodomonas_salina.1